MDLDFVSDEFHLILVQLLFLNYFDSVPFVGSIDLVSFVYFWCVAIPDQIFVRVSIFVAKLEGCYWEFLFTILRNFVFWTQIIRK